MSSAADELVDVESNDRIKAVTTRNNPNRQASAVQPLTAEESRQIALDYIAKHPGRKIFPIKRGAKFPPHISNNLDDASNDPTAIEGWAKQWPGCNWAASHRASEPQIIVADIDDKPGKDGAKTRADLDATDFLGFGFPETEENRSPSGGAHLVYEGRHVYKKDAFGRHIDSPNYTLLPGCVIELLDENKETIRDVDGNVLLGRYELVRDVPAAPAPAWFYHENYLGDPEVDSTTVTPPTDWIPVYTGEQYRERLFKLDVTKFRAEDKWLQILLASTHPSTVYDDEAKESFLEWSCSDELYAGDYDEIEKRWDDNVRLSRQGRLVGGPKPDSQMVKVGTFNRILTEHGLGDLVRRMPETNGAEFADDPIDDAEAAKLPAVKPAVYISHDRWPENTRRVQRLLIALSAKPDAKPADQVFQRTGARQLVHLSRNQLKPGDAERGQDKRNHVENDLMIVRVERGWLADRLERDISFWKASKKKTSVWDPSACPPLLIERLEAIRQDWPYPILNGTVEAPTLRRDGTILDVPGYDAASGLYYDPGHAVFPKVPENPTRADALAALEVLKQPLADFPFADEDGQAGVSRSVALALLLTAVCRRSLPICPMFGIDANLAQSGKTELGQVAAIMMTGRRTAVRTWPHDEYQRKAELAGAFEAGDSVIMYDNINGDSTAVEGDAICAATTEASFKARRLGSNSGEDEIHAPTNALLIGNGNKLTFAGDMTESRALKCDLRPALKLQERTFTHWPLDAYVMANRPKLVAAALTILRAGIVAQDKKAGKTFRFRLWRSWVADTLVWLGEADPVRSAARTVANDPVREGQAAVVRAWIERLGADEPDSKGRSTAEVLNTFGMTRVFADARGVPLAAVNAKSAGKFLTGMVGVKLLGYELLKYTDSHDEISRWRMIATREAVPIDHVVEAVAPEFENADDDDFV
jgi:Bifunctional DNA primase/polymerase, N-terminal